MEEAGVKLLNIMFNPGETICVSPDKYGYHSVPLETVLGGTVTLVPTQESCEKRKIKWEDAIRTVSSDQMTLVSLNPIKGWRQDHFTTAFRSFMVEIDHGSIPDQKKYIENTGLPYSACIFSGNKSLHFLVTLDQDLPGEKEWRHLAEWILNAITLADKNTKNPSRSLRIPGAFREPGKKQLAVKLNGRISLKTLYEWLQKHPDAKPMPPRARRPISDSAAASNLKPHIKAMLKKGPDPVRGRNKHWFAIACEFALAGYSEDDTIQILDQFFTEERDFKEKEWLTSIGSGFKYIYQKNKG